MHGCALAWLALICRPFTQTCTPLLHLRNPALTSVLLDLYVPYGPIQAVNVKTYPPPPPLPGLRFFTVYGPWGRPDMSAQSFARNIMEGKPIKVFRAPDGSELARDFTFIDDIVAGVLGACDNTPASIKGEGGSCSKASW